MTSIRRRLHATATDVGTVLATASYDPYGGVQGTALGSFGFTGELQQGANVYLRARWYNAGRGRFTGRDPFDGWGETPYSLHQYQYAYANPVLWTDARGRCTEGWEADCVVDAPSAPRSMPIDERIDLGYILGLSGEIGSGFYKGDFGAEIVVDFYHFEIGVFHSIGAVGAGITGWSWCGDNLISGAGSAALYGAFVTGWKNFSPKLGVNAYAGPFEAYGASFSIPGVRIPATANFQYFRAPNGAMWGLAFGLGVSSDKLPFSLRAVLNQYSGSHLTLKYHDANSIGDPLPPTPSQAQAFAAALLLCAAIGSPNAYINTVMLIEHN